MKDSIFTRKRKKRNMKPNRVTNEWKRMRKAELMECTCFPFDIIDVIYFYVYLSFCAEHCSIRVCTFYTVYKYAQYNFVLVQVIGNSDSTYEYSRIVQNIYNAVNVWKVHAHTLKIVHVL